NKPLLPSFLLIYLPAFADPFAKEQKQYDGKYQQDCQSDDQIDIVKIFIDRLIAVRFFKLQFLRHLLDGELQVQGGILRKMADAIIPQHFKYRQAVLLDRL